MTANLVNKLKIPKGRIKTAVKRAVIALVLLFIPLVQFYSFIVALPLFMHHSFNSNSQYIEYTFGWFFLKSPIAIAIFSIYYLAVFYVIELFGHIRDLSRPERETKRRQKLGYDK